MITSRTWHIDELADHVSAIPPSCIPDVMEGPVRGRVTSIKILPLRIHPPKVDGDTEDWFDEDWLDEVFEMKEETMDDEGNSEEGTVLPTGDGDVSGGVQAEADTVPAVLDEEPASDAGSLSFIEVEYT
jgi:hypothetical protein